MMANGETNVVVEEEVTAQKMKTVSYTHLRAHET